MSYKMCSAELHAWQKENSNLMTELKPCPFCDNPPVIIPHVSDYLGRKMPTIIDGQQVAPDNIRGFEIRCNSACGMTTVSTGCYDGEFANAKRVWNREAPLKI